MLLWILLCLWAIFSSGCVRDCAKIMPGQDGRFDYKHTEQTLDGNKRVYEVYVDE